MIKRLKDQVMHSKEIIKEFYDQLEAFSNSKYNDFLALQVVSQENDELQKDKKNIQRELEVLSIKIGEERRKKVIGDKKTIAKETLQ